MEMNNIMEHLLNNCSNYPILNFYFKNLSEEKQEQLKQIIKNMKREKLYKSFIHGVYHSEKVCLFAFLLGTSCNLDEVDMQILIDAAMYHDFKRESDFEDSFHGMVSANYIEEIVPLEAVYSDRVNLLLLKAITDFHSQVDRKIRINFDNYELPEEQYGRYVQLASLLKDADALDRTRFSEKCQAALNQKMLRFKESSMMIDLAKEVNFAYNHVMQKNQSDKIPLNKMVGGCLHSIGFDFFRISSVLENGILSFSEMEKLGIQFPRNFDGGNSLRWISVVPTSLIKNDGCAFHNFIKNGISFLCRNQDLYSPMNFNQRDIAILKGLPFDKSGYLDERYVFRKIDPKFIDSIFITQTYADKDVNELSYLYNTLYYETLQNKIIYLLNNMGIQSLDFIPDLIEPMLEYKRALKEYETTDFMEKIMMAPKMKDILTPILDEINKVIQRLIHNYYACVLNKDAESRVTVADAVLFELSKTSKTVKIVDGPDELLFLIEEPQKKKHF